MKLLSINRSHAKVEGNDFQEFSMQQQFPTPPLPASTPSPTPPQNNQPPLLTVSQITNAIKFQLEHTFPSIQVQGEVSNFKRQSSGHLYFSLKDNEAQISCAMFKGNTSNIRTMPKDGDQIIVRGELSVYAPRGGYQIIVRELAFAGIGELLARLEQLKAKLHAMGWFDPARKKPLPKFPRRVGIVTSPTGAAVRDMIHILHRRNDQIEILLNPVKVQGEGAAQEIAQAIHQFNTHNLVDVIIIGRGGGSIEDLWAFNEEIVAHAIFHSRIPIISAVGHETDITLSDFVADLRAPTPSAAAEMVSIEKNQLLQSLTQLNRRLAQNLWQRIQHQKQQLRQVQQHPYIASPYHLLAPHLQKFDDLRERIDETMQNRLANQLLQLTSRKRELSAASPLTQIGHTKQKLDQIEKSLQISIGTKLEQRKQNLLALSQQLRSIDPKNLLTKGYTLLFSQKDGSVITSADQMHHGDGIVLRLANGEARARVEEVIKHE